MKINIFIGSTNNINVWYININIYISINRRIILTTDFYLDFYSIQYSIIILIHIDIGYRFEDILYILYINLFRYSMCGYNNNIM